MKDILRFKSKVISTITTHTHTHTHTHRDPHTSTDAHVHTYIRAPTPTHTPTYTRTHTFCLALSHIFEWTKSSHLVLFLSDTHQTFTHKHTHKHKHTQTHAKPRSLLNVKAVERENKNPLIERFSDWWRHWRLNGQIGWSKSWLDSDITIREKHNLFNFEGYNWNTLTLIMLIMSFATFFTVPCQCSKALIVTDVDNDLP